jgi:glycylpeptide N-tetradecanoyltransferase
VSFYTLDSSILGNRRQSNLHAAYLFYYATEAAFSENSDVEILKKRLQTLVNDALILAKQNNFAVFNALSLMDNPLFMNELKFLPGTGQLHYYLYNYRASAIAGGINEQLELQENKCSGLGFIGI